METLYIFTDGSSLNKTKEGGWAFCTTDDPKSKKDAVHSAYGYGADTTNNRMELTAVINGLEYCYANHPKIRKVVVYSDSEYVSNPIYYGWLQEWRGNNWIKNDGAETKNSDLWEEMYQILNRFKFRNIEVSVLWVRGHNGHHFNEICDKLAKKGRESKQLNTLY